MYKEKQLLYSNWSNLKNKNKKSETQTNTNKGLITLKIFLSPKSNIMIKFSTSSKKRKAFIKINFSALKQTLLNSIRKLQKGTRVNWIGHWLLILSYDLHI